MAGIVIEPICNTNTMKRNIPMRLNNKGFTLIELLIATVVSGMVVSGTVLVFRTMVRDHNTEVRVLGMQQNLRSTMQYIERYIRMAGYDPTEQTNAGFTTMLSNQIAFTRDKGTVTGTTIDNTPNGQIDNHWEEQVQFRLKEGRIERIDSGGNGQLLAENIDVLNFVYLDKDGAPTSAADDIKSVQVAIVARFSSGDPGYVAQYTNNEEYRNQQGAMILPPQNDNIRRMMLTADVNCRNMAW